MEAAISLQKFPTVYRSVQFFLFLMIAGDLTSERKRDNRLRGGV